MKKLIVSAALLLAAFAPSRASAQSILGPYSTALNASVDLAGTPDMRPGAWGNAASATNNFPFYPPAGYITRILHIYGDFVAWPKSGIMAAGTSSEVGWGLKSSLPDGSVHNLYGFDNTFIWIQNAVLAGDPSPRMAFDRDVHVGGRLGSDNILISQTFVALNTSGLTIHMEPTLVVVFQFEPI